MRVDATRDPVARPDRADSVASAPHRRSVHTPVACLALAVLPAVMALADC